jgi:PhnB protein
MTNAIPDGYHSLTTTLVVDRGREAIEFYERAFGAEVHTRLTAGEKVVFAALRIGDSLVTLCDEMPGHGLAAPDPDGPVPSFVTIYCDDADALHARAIEAGATENTPVSDQVHGDRAGSLRCPFGHRWAVATHVEDLGEAQMQQRIDQWTD